MTRAGLTTDSVVAAATDIIDREGQDTLTLAGLATQLGVKAPSLYNHIEGIDALRRLVALAAIDELAEETRTSAMGRSGPAALRSIAHAYRKVALTRPGTYALIQVARPGDGAWEAASARVLEPVLAVLAGMGLHGEEAIHATRALRSAVHGFVSLETSSGFGLEVDLDTSFERMVGLVATGLGARSA